MGKRIIHVLVLLTIMSSFALAIDGSVQANSAAAGVSRNVSSAAPVSSIRTATVVAARVPEVVSASSASISISDCISEELNSEMRSLYARLNSESANMSQEEIREIKTRIENLSIQINNRKSQCLAVQEQQKISNNDCVNESLGQEMVSLELKLQEALRNGDEEAANLVRNRKEEVIRLMKQQQENCIATHSVSEISQPPSVSVPEIISCQQLDIYRQKLVALKDEMASQQAHDPSSAAIERLMTETNSLEQAVSRYEEQCSADTRSNLGQIVRQAVSDNQAGAGDIVAYYKARISQIVSSDSFTDVQIQHLKDLRDEIDSMIRELIEKSGTIDATEVSSVVSEIRIAPAEISADQVRITASDKTIFSKLNNGPVEILNNGSSVILDSDGVSAEARELILSNNTIRVGNSELGISPSDAIQNLGVVPKKIEILEENNRSVYMVRADETRRLLGIIEIRVENRFKIDGVNGSIVSQEAPWWSFLTTSAE